MGTIFENSDEYPDYIPMPRFTATVNGVVVPLAVAATMVGLCPVELIDHEQPHTPHQSHNPVGMVTLYEVSSSGVSSIAPDTGRVSFAGHAPTIKIG